MLAKGYSMLATLTELLFFHFFIPLRGSLYRGANVAPPSRIPSPLSIHRKHLSAAVRSRFFRSGLLPSGSRVLPIALPPPLPLAALFYFWVVIYRFWYFVAPCGSTKFGEASRVGDDDLSSAAIREREKDVPRSLGWAR